MNMIIALNTTSLLFGYIIISNTSIVKSKRIV